MIGDKVIAYVLGLVLAACSLWAGAQTLRLAAAKRTLAELRLVIEQERRQAAEDHAKAVEASRIEERRRTLAVQEKDREAQDRARRARVDAVDARVSGDGLRAHAGGLAARCGVGAGDSAPAAVGTPAGDAGRMLADLLGSLEQAAREYAEIADQRGIAGAACERSYDALTPGR